MKKPPRHRAAHQLLWLTYHSKRGEARHYPYQVTQRMASVMELLGQWQQAEALFARNRDNAERAGQPLLTADATDSLGRLAVDRGITLLPQR